MADKKRNLEFIDVPVSDSHNAPAVTSPIAQDSASLMNTFRTTFAQSRHPIALMFHMLFKGLALFTYIFAGWFSESFVFVFVICILLLAFDFWTVKNVTGRLLVGLRWWNRIKEDGSNEWVFESAEDTSEISPTESRLFWLVLYLTPVVWFLLLIIAFLKLNVTWMVIVLAAITLSTANIIGYTKCRKDASSRMKSFVEKGALSALQGRRGSSVLSSLGAAALGTFSSAISPGASSGANQSRREGQGDSLLNRDTDPAYQV